MEDTINPGNIMMKFTAPEDLDIRSVTSRVTENVTDKATDTLDETERGAGGFGHSGKK